MRANFAFFVAALRWISIFWPLASFGSAIRTRPWVARTRKPLSVNARGATAFLVVLFVVVPLTASAPLAAPPAADADAGGGTSVATAVAMFDFAAANQRPSQN